jgi:hypothetical protein
VVKYFRFSYDYVLWEISFTNLNMLLMTIPVYDYDLDEDDPEKPKEVESIQDLFSSINLE